MQLWRRTANPSREALSSIKALLVLGNHVETVILLFSQLNVLCNVLRLQQPWSVKHPNYWLLENSKFPPPNLVDSVFHVIGNKAQRCNSSQENTQRNSEYDPRLGNTTPGGGLPLNKGGSCHWGFAISTWDNLRSCQHFGYFLASKHTRKNFFRIPTGLFLWHLSVYNVAVSCFPVHSVSNTADFSQDSHHVIFPLTTILY